MDTHAHTDTNDGPSGAGKLLRAKSTWVLAGFLAIAAFFLLTEHTAHTLGALPFLLLLACPLLHVFMHGGHGGGGAHGGHGERGQADQGQSGQSATRSGVAR